jgi:hypothetical protein
MASSNATRPDQANVDHAVQLAVVQDSDPGTGLFRIQKVASDRVRCALRPEVEESRTWMGAKGFAILNLQEQR